ncbi:unnamed protein product, partial [Ectocarpus sp. 12 AP-2014]
SACVKQFSFHPECGRRDFGSSSWQDRAEVRSAVFRSTSGCRSRQQRTANARGLLRDGGGAVAHRTCSNHQRGQLLRVSPRGRVRGDHVVARGASSGCVGSGLPGAGGARRRDCVQDFPGLGAVRGNGQEQQGGPRHSPRPVRRGNNRGPGKTLGPLGLVQGGFLGARESCEKSGGGCSAL